MVGFSCSTSLRLRYITGARSTGLGHARGVRDAGEDKEIDGDLTVAQEILRGTKLLGVAVHEGERGVGGREAVGMDLPVPGRGVLGRHERHVAVRALLGLGRVVERARAL